MTQCPQCQTEQRLTPELLQSQQGWVMCRHCSVTYNVFDREIKPPPPASVEQSALPAAASMGVEPADVSIVAEPINTRAATPSPDAPPPHLEISAVDRPAPATPSTASRPSSDFNSFWTLFKSRFGTLILTTLSIGFTVSALGLIGFIWKDQLTKVEVIGPALRLALHRLDDHITIQTTEDDFVLSNVSNTPLSKDQGFKLSFNLSNQTAIDLPLPNICVTLLNTHDEPIAFRIIPIAASSTVLAAHQALSSSIEWVPIHDTHSLLVAWAANPSDQRCYHDIKVLMSL